MQEDKNRKTERQSEEPKKEKPVSEDWYTQALEELDEFIESQGIYIRQ